MPLRRPLVAAAAAVLLVLPACGSDNKVGDESLLDFKEQAENNLNTTTTEAAAAAASTTAPPTTATGQQNAKAGVTATTSAPVTTAVVAAIDININSDEGDTTQFDPSDARVFRGQLVKWVNKDSQPRSVESDDGKTFRSPTIAPGQSWTWKAEAVGDFNYHDGTRPYAVAKLEVVPR
jgi:plastocyanin